MMSGPGFDRVIFRGQASEFLRHLVAQTQIPGAAIAVSVEGEPTCVSAGRNRVDLETPINEDSRFALGGLIQLIGSIVTLELAARGRVDLSCPIGRYLLE